MMPKHTWADVAVDNVKSPSLISLNIKYSKTDQGRVGIHVVLGKTGEGFMSCIRIAKLLIKKRG